MTMTMQAAIYEQYGKPEVLRLSTVSKPQAGRGELLVRVHTTAATIADSRLRRADPFAARFVFGLFRPKNRILGDAFSGVVEAVGEGVQQFRVGDAVFGICGMKMGAYAEYVCVPATGVIIHKPAEISDETAAAAQFGGATALHFLQKANVQPGQKVMIYGASGSVGSAAVQIARYMGAHVTAVCSAANTERVRALGADRVLDYAREQFWAEGPQYDVVFETVNKVAVGHCFKALKPGGKFIIGAGLLKEMLQGAWASLWSGKKVIAGVALGSVEKLEFLKKMLLEGAFTPLIDRVLPLSDIVAAHHLIDSGRKSGNVVVRVKQ